MILNQRFHIIDMLPNQGLFFQKSTLLNVFDLNQLSVIFKGRKYKFIDETILIIFRKRNMSHFGQARNQEASLCIHFLVKLRPKDDKFR